MAVLVRLSHVSKHVASLQNGKNSVLFRVGSALVGTCVIVMPCRSLSIYLFDCECNGRFAGNFKVLHVSHALLLPKVMRN